MNARRASPALRVALAAAAAAALGAAAACRAGYESRAMSEPAVPAGEIRFGGAAVRSAAGVEVRAALGEWEGRPEQLAREVTPVRVEIVNRGARPVLVRYGRVALESAAGRRYEPFDPYGPDMMEPESAAARSGFGYRDYALAPYYEGRYDFVTGLDIWEGDVRRDREYEEAHRMPWSAGAPKDDTLPQAVPEGVVKPGGSVIGNLYFERVPSEVSELTYTAEIVDAETGEKLGEVRIPVERR